MERTPCRASCLYEAIDHISFYSCSVSGLPSLLGTSAPVTLESLHWGVVLKVSFSFASGLVAVLQLSVAVR